MPVTDQEFTRLTKRVNDLESIEAGKRLKNIREDLDNAHAAFIALRAEHDALRADYDALCGRHDALLARVQALEAASVPPMLAAA